MSHGDKFSIAGSGGELGQPLGASGILVHIVPLLSAMPPTLGIEEKGDV